MNDKNNYSFGVLPYGHNMKPLAEAGRGPMLAAVSLLVAALLARGRLTRAHGLLLAGDPGRLRGRARADGLTGRMILRRPPRRLAG